MEQNTAILIADLSGYTALTEAHGASTAANTIDIFLNIVLGSLVGNSKLHQRIGDEVMIVADSADDLIETSLKLADNCSKQHLFLQIHGGLHFGKVLKHNGHYFGSPINQTSRIAGKARNGSFWCSLNFINALSSPSSYTFVSKGKQEFKNVSESLEVFEIMSSETVDFNIDPVCRMLIHDKSTAIPHPHNSNIFFCSSYCLNTSVNAYQV